MDERINNYSNGKKYLVMNDEIASVIELVCQHLNNEEEFEQDGRELDKGLFLGGGVGSGKTEIMQAYKGIRKRYMKFPILFAKCQDANDAYMKIDKATNHIQGYDGIRHSINEANRSEFIFDELGGEETYVIDYGNKVAVMPYVIDRRERHDFPVRKTHYTSNLSKEQILEKYGSRIESRLYKSVNFIGLGISKASIDHRKQ